MEETSSFFHLDIWSGEMSKLILIGGFNVNLIKQEEKRIKPLYYLMENMKLEIIRAGTRTRKELDFGIKEENCCLTLVPGGSISDHKTRKEGD